MSLAGGEPEVTAMSTVSYSTPAVPVYTWPLDECFLGLRREMLQRVVNVLQQRTWWQTTEMPPLTSWPRSGVSITFDDYEQWMSYAERTP